MKRGRNSKRKNSCKVLSLLLALVLVFGTLSDTGYATVSAAEGGQALACSYELHEHDDSCYDSDGNIVCGYADYVVHTHEENCYDGDGNLICELNEIEAHEHDASCYDADGNLTCGKEEIILHTHSDSCYDSDGNLTCGKLQVEEHQHSADCLSASADEENASDAGTDTDGTDTTGTDADGTESALTEEETTSAVEELQERIDALPSVAELEEMDGDEIEEVYAEVCDISDIYYDELTEEQQEEIDADKLLALLEYFTGAVATLAANDDISDDSYDYDPDNGTWLGTWPNYETSGDGYSGAEITFTVTPYEYHDDYMLEDDPLEMDKETGLYPIEQKINNADAVYFIQFTASFSSLAEGIYYYQLPTQFTYEETTAYYSGNSVSHGICVHVSETGLVTIHVHSSGGNVNLYYEEDWTSTYALDPSGGNDEGYPSSYKVMTVTPGNTNDYTATYTVTLNQIHYDYGTGSIIMVDTMTNLAYVSGSMEIVETDSGTTLEEGTDYVVVVETESDGSTTLTVTIYNAGDKEYTLTYDAYVVNVSSGVSYANVANGWRTSGHLPNSNVSMTRYAVSVSKTDAATGSALAGATFALYVVDSSGNATQATNTSGQAMTVTTDSSGQAIFSTGVNSYYGFAEETLFYIQETDAPTGYEIATDDNGENLKYYFCFCNVSGGCDTCKVYAETYGATIITPLYSSYYAGTIEVENKYTATGTLTLGVSKTYNSWSTMSSDESFVFRLGSTSGSPLPESNEYTTERNSDGADITYASISISGSDANGKSDGESVSQSFGEITFTSAGTYTYYLDEIRQSNMPAGVSITGVREYEITVVASDNGDGTLTVEITEVTYTDPESSETVTKTGDDLTNFTFDFDNTYEAGSQSRALLGYKTFTNNARQNDTNWGGRSFSFLFTALDGAPTPDSVTTTEDSDGNSTWSVTTTSRTFTSGNITFTMDDVGKDYYYSIQEQLTIDGVTYTVSELAATDEDKLPDGVTLKKDDNGNVIAVTYQGTHYDPTIVYARMSVKYDNETIDAITVTDSYGDEAIYTLQIITYGGKTYNYTGTNDNDAGLSYYEYYNEDGTLEVLAYNPGNYGVTVTVYDEDRNVSSTTEGTLDEAVYSNDYGTVTYNVDSETYTDGDGNTIDSGNVTRNKSAYIVAVSVAYGTFVDGEFVPYDDDDDTHQTTQETAGGETTRALFSNSYDAEAVTSAALTGTKTLGGREFEDGDTFTFNITKANWTSGNTEWDTDDMPDFEITYETGDEDDDGNAVTETVTFTSVTITCHAATGTDGAYFTVAYINSNGETVYSYTSTDAVTATENSDGSVSNSFNFDIGQVTFTLVGDYTYILSETSGSLSYMAYSGATHRIVYSVENDQEGSLYVSSVTVDGTDSTDADQNVTWTNRYRYTAYSPSVTKTLKSLGGAEITEDFTFALYSGYDEDTGELSGQIGTATVTGSGKVEFDSVTYTSIGTNTYYIQEIVPDEKTEGMTYDDSVIRVDVAVSQTVAGGLYVSSAAYTNLSTEERVVYSYDAAGEVTTTYYTGTQDSDSGTWTFEETDTANDANVITNVYNEQIDITGTKTWDDANDQDGKRPESITIRLLADGEEIDSVTVTEDNNWAYSFTGLDKYRDGGVEIAYTITEDAVSGYTTTYDGYNVTNTYTPGYTGVTVNKVWVLDDGGTATSSVTVNLLRDGSVYDTVTLSADNNWTYTWTGLNDSYTWTVEEADVPEGFTSAVTGSGTTWTITNDDTPEDEDTPDTPDDSTPDTPSTPGTSDDVPKTGDETNLSLWLVLMILALAGMGITLLIGRRKNTDE